MTGYLLKLTIVNKEEQVKGYEITKHLMADDETSSSGDFEASLFMTGISNKSLSA